ncbi:MAG: Asp-tRNA(Asn)/Glu-tRNA(Gln) amidotransferase subunit GatA, partial [Bacteroidetes bacterium]
AYASSFDQIGPLTKSIEDAALITQVIAGMDEYDTTCSSKPVDNYTESINSPEKKYKITYFKSYIEKEGLDPEIKEHLLNTIENLKAQGHTVEASDFPFLDYVVPTYYVLTTAEASSNLARYDGIHFGYRSPNAHDLESTYVLSRSEGFGDEVKRRIMLGTYVLSAGYYDAYYAKGQKVRRILKQETERILSEYNFILLPTTPGTAFKIGEQIDDPIKMYLEDIFTVQANLTGVPAISLPTGKHSNGLPFGIQIMSKHFAESELFAFANTFNINA